MPPRLKSYFSKQIAVNQGNFATLCKVSLKNDIPQNRGGAGNRAKLKKLARHPLSANIS
jgi:hypothetical protein